MISLEPTLDFCLLVICDMMSHDRMRILLIQETAFKLDDYAYSDVRDWQRSGTKLWGQCTVNRNFPFGCGLGKTPMVNEIELVINLVKAKRRKGSDTPYQNGIAACRRYFNLNVYPTFEQPGNSEYLRELKNVEHAEHGKPDKPHSHQRQGIPTVRKGEGLAGKGSKRKRMPPCNRADRV